MYLFPIEIGTGNGFSYLPLTETLGNKGFQTPFRNALLTHVECL